MRKASTQKAVAVNLGTKRACRKCGTKFYDFGKSELSCPKCRHKMTAEELAANPIYIEPKKKAEKPAPASLIDDEETTVVTGDGFESAEDLTDDDDDVVVEEVDVDEDEDDDKY